MKFSTLMRAVSRSDSDALFRLASYMARKEVGNPRRLPPMVRIMTVASAANGTYGTGSPRHFHEECGLRSDEEV